MRTVSASGLMSMVALYISNAAYTFYIVTMASSSGSYQQTPAISPFEYLFFLFLAGIAFVMTGVGILLNSLVRHNGLTFTRLFYMIWLTILGLIDVIFSQTWTPPVFFATAAFGTSTSAYLVLLIVIPATVTASLLWFIYAAAKRQNSSGRRSAVSHVRR